jgi:hypothetical protein
MHGMHASRSTIFSGTDVTARSMKERSTNAISALHYMQPSPSKALSRRASTTADIHAYNKHRRPQTSAGLRTGASAAASQSSSHMIDFINQSSGSMTESQNASQISAVLGNSVEAGNSNQTNQTAKTYESVRSSVPAHRLSDGGSRPKLKRAQSASRVPRTSYQTTLLFPYSNAKQLTGEDPLAGMSRPASRSGLRTVASVREDRGFR